MFKLVYANEVKSILESKGYVATVVENARNNASNVGISVKREDNVSPIFYITDDMEDPEIFADKIISFEPDHIDMDAISDVMLDREEVLRRSHYILVNTALNQKRDSIVRVPINETLELHYKIDVSDIMEDAKISLEKKHIERLDIPLSELAHRAYYNTMKDYKPEIYDLNELLPEVFDIPIISEFKVLSNEQKVYGAGVVLYEGMYKKLKEVMKGDFIIIPSSIHEVIVLKTEYGDVDEEILSDRPYKLIKDKKLVEA